MFESDPSAIIDIPELWKKNWIFKIRKKMRPKEHGILSLFSKIWVCFSFYSGNLTLDDV
jgi:hypothetical protein